MGVVRAVAYAWDVVRWRMDMHTHDAVPASTAVLVLGLAATWGVLPTLAVVVGIASVWCWMGILLRIDRLGAAPLIACCHAAASWCAASQLHVWVLAWWVPRRTGGVVVWSPLEAWEAMWIAGAVVPACAVLMFVLSLGALHAIVGSLMFLHRLGRDV